MKTTFSLLILLFIPALVTAQGSSPQQVADELLVADRTFAEASAKSDLVGGLSAMFAAEVAMPSPGGLVFGSAKAVDALKANPANAGAKATWTPARVGLSADGTHGFTAGFMTITRADGSVNPAKYLAYWEKQSNGWRVLVYKRTPAKSAAPAMPVSYVLPFARGGPELVEGPKQIVAAQHDSAAIETHRGSLAEAERSFSRDAQTMGLTAAFKKYGDPQAINLGSADLAVFLIGNEQIGEDVGRGSPTNSSPLHWGPDRTIIAGSGDFGVTVGYLVQNQPGPDGKPLPRIPFFTIWRRDAAGVWRYIAE